MKIIKFDNPEKKTIQEIIDAYKKDKHYIVKTIYGDFDNVVEFAICDLEIDLKYTRFYPNSIYGPKWFVAIRETNKNIYPLERNNKTWDKIDNSIAYNDNFHLEHIEDIFNQMVEVIGYVDRRENN